nr:hypothetical protein [uncultured Pseudodesulfovibrio sp.]
MSLGKGILLVGGTLIAAGALASSPLVTVASPFLWWGAKTIKVSSAAVAGIGAAAMAGASAGKITGSTGTALMVQSLDDISKGLAEKLSAKPKQES